MSRVLAGRSQVFDDAWAKRLGISRRDFGIGMTSAEVSAASMERAAAAGAFPAARREGVV